MADKRYIKGTISYTPEIDEISRKFVRRSTTANSGKKAGPVYFEANGWMGGSVRTSIRAGLGQVRRNTLVVRTQGITTPPSAEQMATRSLFIFVAKAITPLLEDLTQMTQMQRLWAEAQANPSKTMNGVAAYGYTYRGWVFAVQFAGKKANNSYDLSKFPAAFDA